MQRNLLTNGFRFCLFVILCLSDVNADPAALTEQIQQQFAAANYANVKILAHELAQTPTLKGEAHYWLGRSALRQRQWQSAVDELEMAVEMNPMSAEFHLRYAQALWFLAGDRDTSFLRKPGLASACRKAFETAIKLDPMLIEAHRGLLELYAQVPAFFGGGMAKAKKSAARLAQLSELEGELAYAHLAMRNEQLPELSKHYRRAAELAPEHDHEYRYQEMLAYLLAQDYASAHAMLTALRTQQPNAARLQYQLGRLAVFAEKPEYYGEAEAALLAYLQRSDLGEDDIAPAWAALRLGEIYALKGEKVLARARFQWAATQQPDARLQAELGEKSMAD